MSVNIKYSTGPVENAIGIAGLPGTSRTLLVKALNNGKKTATVTIRLFALNGKKVLKATRTFTLAAGVSDFSEFNVANFLQFEVTISTNSKYVLVSAWGKNVNGRLVAAHRFTQRELVKSWIK